MPTTAVPPSLPAARPRSGRQPRRRRAIGASAGLAALVGGSVVAAALPSRPTTAALPPLRLASATVTSAAPSVTNPARSRNPGPGFVRYCLPHGGTYLGTVAQCNADAYYNVVRARSLEGLGPISLPRDFASLTLSTQLVVAADGERKTWGLANLGENASLDIRANQAAAEYTDPTGPSGYRWVSTWSGGYRTPLAADYAWMYDDGYGGTNGACTYPGAPGCWSHRDAILADFAGAIGGGQRGTGSDWSFTELLVANYPG